MSDQIRKYFATIKDKISMKIPPQDPETWCGKGIILWDVRCEDEYMPRGHRRYILKNDFVESRKWFAGIKHSEENLNKIIENATASTDKFVEEFSISEDATIYTLCNGGHRSGIICFFLQEKFKNAISIKGGIEADWAKSKEWEPIIKGNL